jgi:hypothetical protein
LLRLALLAAGHPAGHSQGPTRSNIRAANAKSGATTHDQVVALQSVQTLCSAGGTRHRRRPVGLCCRVRMAGSRRCLVVDPAAPRRDGGGAGGSTPPRGFRQRVGCPVQFPEADRLGQAPLRLSGSRPSKGVDESISSSRHWRRRGVHRTRTSDLIGHLDHQLSPPPDAQRLPGSRCSSSLSLPCGRTPGVERRVELGVVVGGHE